MAKNRAAVQVNIVGRDGHQFFLLTLTSVVLLLYSTVKKDLP